MVSQYTGLLHYVIGISYCWLTKGHWFDHKYQLPDSWTDPLLRIHSQESQYSALQNQKAVTAYLRSEQILYFVIARQYRLTDIAVIPDLLSSSHENAASRAHDVGIILTQSWPSFAWAEPTDVTPTSPLVEK